MQILVNGIIQGLLFALMGLAFALVYNTTRVFHVALGAIYALAPYVYLACVSAGLHPGFCILATFLTCAVLGLLCEVSLHWPFLRKSAPSEVHLIGSLGMFLVIIQVIVLIWGNDTHVLRAGIDSVRTFGSIRLTNAQFEGGMIALSILLMTFVLPLKKSQFGLLFHALADNPTLVSLLGHNVRFIRLFIFMLSGLTAAIAALASAFDVGFDPYGGMKAVLIGMVATIVGGRGSFAGAVIAGIMLGIIRSQVVWYASSRWEEMITFLILALILFFRPQGLFGRTMRLEEKA